MKSEYDFSKGERGKFYHPDAVLELPVYLEPDVVKYLSDRAEDKGVGLDEMANEMLRKDIALVETVK